MELESFECEAHGALAIVSPASIFVLLNDQLLGEIQERVIDVGPILRARFNHGYSWVRLLELLYLIIAHLDLSFIIHLVGKDHNFDIGA